MNIIKKEINKRNNKESKNSYKILDFSKEN